MGTMLKYGSEGAKAFIDAYVLPEDMAKAHAQGDIHIHDKDFYLLTETCCQINLDKLFKGGFSTGHGVLREPQSIESTLPWPASPSKPTKTKCTAAKPSPT
jgi:anaerobic ribonucleoside-triphosphate reductase